MLWAVKGLAPTRPALAGACVGLASAAAGAAVYVLHCPEMQAPFLAVWYALGMFLPAAVGAVVGADLLRWCPPGHAPLPKLQTVAYKLTHKTTQIWGGGALACTLKFCNLFAWGG